MKSPTTKCVNGHEWTDNERWRIVTREGKSVRRRYCLACKRDWNKARYATKRKKYAKENGLANKAEWATPTLQVKARVKLACVLDNGARYTILEPVIQGV